MADLLASVPVLLAGVYLVALAAVALVSPERARRFLSSFASSASAHFFELFVRLVVGAALVLYAPQMKFPGLFALFGWVIVVTTIGLLVIPWRWHRRFATWSVPHATRNMRLFAVASLGAGIFVLLSVVLGPGLQKASRRDAEARREPLPISLCVSASLRESVFKNLGS